MKTVFKTYKNYGLSLFGLVFFSSLCAQKLVDINLNGMEESVKKTSIEKTLTSTTNDCVRIAVIDSGVAFFAADRLTDLGFTEVSLLPPTADSVDFQNFDIVFLPMQWAQASNGDYGLIESQADSYHAFIGGGGSLIIGQPNPFGQAGGEVDVNVSPYPFVADASYSQNDNPEVVVAGHPLVAGINNSDLPSPTDFITLNEEYEVIVRGSSSQLPSLAYASFGAGHVLLFISVSAQDSFSPVGDDFYSGMIEWLYSLNNDPIVANISLEANTVLTTYAGLGNVQWIDCETGLAVEGAIETSFTPSVSGEYAVTITEECSVTSECIFVNALSITDHEEAASFKLFPNPNAGVFSLRFAYEGPATVQLISVEGKVVWEEQLAASELSDLAVEVPSGVYFLRVYHQEAWSGRRVLIE